MQKGTGWTPPQTKSWIKTGAVPRPCRKSDDSSLCTGEEQIGPEIRERIHVRYVQRLLLPWVLDGKSLPLSPRVGLDSMQGALAHPFFVGSVPEDRVVSVTTPWSYIFVALLLHPHLRTIGDPW